MGVEIPNGYGQATIRFGCTGVLDPMVVTFGISGTTDVDTPTEVQAAANTIFGMLTASGKLLSPNVVSTDYTILGVDLMVMHGGNPTVGVSSNGTSPGILGSTPVLPPNCAILVKKGTGLGGRRGRGRMYFPPLWVGEAFVNANGQLVAGQSTAIQTRLSTFLLDLSTAGLPMVLHHGIAIGGGDFITQPALPAPTLVTSLTVQQLLATQRRRLR